MTLKRASLADFADAQLLLAEYYEAVDVVHRDTPEQVEIFLHDPLSGMWLAYAEGLPVACAILRPLSQIAHASECKRLYVRPAFRGRGIAGRLLEMMEAFAGEIGSVWIYLDSKDDLREALRLYRAAGYEPCERYNENSQATVFLRKRVTGKE